MKGKDLRYSIQQSGIKIKELAKLTPIKERTIYNLYEKEEVEQHYIKDLEKAGVKMLIAPGSDLHYPENSATEVDLLKRIINNLEDEVDFLRYLVSEKNGIAFKKKNHVFSDSQKNKEKGMS